MRVWCFFMWENIETKELWSIRVVEVWTTVGFDKNKEKNGG